MLGSFDPTAWYAWLVYIAGGYLLWTAVFETGHKHVRWLWERFRGTPAEPEATGILTATVRQMQAELRHLIDSERGVELRIVELVPTGGGTFVDFRALVQNVGTKPARMKVTARVGDRAIEASPEIPDLLVNAAPVRVTIWVPRPELGELMKECGHATTLYGETLHFRVDADGHHAEGSWSEELYDPDTDRARHEVQQRYWRRGRGEETEHDRRAEALLRHEQRIESDETRSERLEDI